MKNNYFKIIIPCVSKNYFNFEGEKNNKYKGKAILVIEKNTNNGKNKLVFNTLLLDENQEIWGADNGRFGEKYPIKKYKELFDFRQRSFNYSLPKGRKKNKSKFQSSIKELNNLILKNKLTIKEVDAFISGSNSSGGLKNPNADPIRMVASYNDSFFNDFNDFEIKDKMNNEWKIFSLISNIDKISWNKIFPDDIDISYINDLEEREMNGIFNLDWSVIPWGLKHSIEDYVKFKSAFISQNFENFVNLNKNNDLLFLPEKYWNKNNRPSDLLINLLNSNSRNYVKNKLRSHWSRIINESIETNKYNTDFVKKISKFDRAHIIDNDFVVNFLLNESNSFFDKEEIIQFLFNKNNYVLLDKTLHTYWDDGDIEISENGEIINLKLSESEFHGATNGKTNIYMVYENVINNERSLLLNKRIEFLSTK